jgi:uncharacterized membrane protein AbrB (regulator of aidB expression)
MKVALAFVVGSALTAVGILLTGVNDAEWVRWVFLFPWALLGTLIPHPNIGTPEHPFHEGTPLDLPAAVIGLAMSALMNIVIAYYVLPRLHRLRGRL